MLITAFLPYVGYKRAEALLAGYKQHEADLSFRDYLSSELGEELVTKVLKPLSLMALGYRKRN